MNELEMKIEALTRCVNADIYAKALAEVKGGSQPKFCLNAKHLIQDELKELGIPAHIKGYRYIITALQLIIADPGIIDAVTKELYPQVAEAHGTTPARAERAIRHAIELAFERGDLSLLNKYFGNTVSARRGKTTNSEFLAAVAETIRQKMK